MKTNDFFKLVNKGIETILKAEMRNSVSTSPDKVYLAVTWWNGGYHAITSWDYDQRECTLFINCSKEELKCINNYRSTRITPLPFYINEHAKRAEDAVKLPATLDHLTQKKQTILGFTAEPTNELMSCREICEIQNIKYVLVKINDEPVDKIVDINPISSYIIRNEYGSLFMIFQTGANFSYRVQRNEEVGAIECTQLFHDRSYELDNTATSQSESNRIDNLNMQFIDDFSDNGECGCAAG